MSADTPAPPPLPFYYQLKAELDVSFRRYVKEMADEIVKRIDRSELERREERRELEERVRKLEQSLPVDLAEQLRDLQEQGASTRATGKLLITIFGFALTIIGIGVAILTVIH